MREGRDNGGADGEGGGSAAVEGINRRPRQPRDASSPPPSSSSSSSCAAALASCGRSEAEGEEGQDNQGGGKKQGRRKGKRREVVARAIRDRLPAAPSCWGNVSVVQGVGGRRGRSRRERPGDDGEDDCGAGTTARAPAAAWCCVCPAGDCALEPNPSANGKEDAGLRSLIERNDFYSDDCNPHADVLPAAAAAHPPRSKPAAHFD